MRRGDGRRYFDTSDLTGNSAPVSLERILADNGDLPPGEMKGLRTCPIGGKVNMGIGGGHVTFVRVLAPRSGPSRRKSADTARPRRGPVSVSALGGKTTERQVEAAKEEYRALVRQQRKMPSDEQWKMGSALKHAKARAYMLVEALRLGQ